MSDHASRSLLDVLLRWTLALAFAVAAGLKMGNLSQATSETMFSALPAGLKAALVATELSLACLLVSGHFRKFTAGATALMLCGFLGALLWELAKPDPRPCGCFGTMSPSSPGPARHLLWLTLTLDAFLLTSALILMFRKPAPGSDTSA